ncbi:Peptidyl-prolyl cis-trans isomerase NIMA-interacting protein 1 [Coemansia sp. RSA 1813]|nr:Peptidyl-prolyl cis-trans isomerase NIMA-interacting protein 1 [Coemansia sp. RSA 1843]KAJ2090944.1 Peptidyl-prolyl cis-trans isomerase NIMA-interacting protein 1 [Coemansia sp. RSA 986]KAJ2213988.1 Peptidyl-prolyl cis-trans isomerase NIMA-interacting protein 1 [Coemansia sp. RSA 487]KAJ2571230.1 Peptidyl-prolyl cis-trans isomerase NIMA-interacting protein 1 [Coemansia sp. RSA 1813]
MEEHQNDCSALPPNWEVRKSRTYNKTYYFNRETKESRWDPPTGEAPSRMRASHILAKHRDSRNPRTWRGVEITRSEEEAREKIADIRQAIENKEVDFGDIALEESDCSSAKRKGDLGWFEEGKMQPAFESAVKALQVGELSGQVKSDSGIHIILRTG